MTFLLRKIKLGKQWLAAKTNDIASPPPWAYGEFIPRLAEQEVSLSFYEAINADVDAAAPIASGLSFGLSSDSNQYFVAVACKNVEESGFTIERDGAGTTFHRVVDPTHASIEVQTSADLEKIVALYWGGELIIVKSAVVQGRRCADMRNGLFRIGEALKIKPAKQEQTQHFLSHIRSSDILFRGADQPA